MFQQSAITYLSFAAASKLVAITATYPYQLMRTRMQDQYHEFNGAMDMFTRTWRCGHVEKTTIIHNSSFVR